MKRAWCILAICLCMMARMYDSAAAAEPVLQKEDPLEEIIAVVPSEAQAQELAQQYQLILDSYACGIAVFKTYSADAFLSSPQILQEEEFFFSENRLYDALEIPEKTGTSAAQIPQYHHAEIDTETAWQYTQGQGTLVAVIDTGIDVNHPEFLGRIAPFSYNAHTDQVGIEYVKDTNGHGTHVAGLIAANSDGTGVNGIAPETSLMVIKASRAADDRFEMASILRGINYAIERNADVINLSLGISYFNGENKAERQVLAQAVESGAVIVCAAGNSAEKHACYPAAYPETIAVSATKEGFLFDENYSNNGPEIDIAAPGTKVVSTWLGGGYTDLTGTSMACPIVSGTAALVCALYPDSTPEQIRDILCSTAAEAGKIGKDERFGHGVVNAGAAVAPSENLVKVAYNLNDPDQRKHYVSVLKGNCLIPPELPTRAGYHFNGWFQGKDKFDFSTAIQEEITLTANWSTNTEATGGCVSGVVRSYNGKIPCSIRLIRDDIVWYSTMIASNHDVGLREQGFLLENVMEGKYRLEIEKAGQLKYIVHDIVIKNKPIDLSLEEGKPYQVIELIAGDVNQDGKINMSDINQVLNAGNFNVSENPANNLTDINGDGITDYLDLNYIWKDDVYNKSSKTNCNWFYENEQERV